MAAGYRRLVLGPLEGLIADGMAAGEIAPGDAGAVAGALGCLFALLGLLAFDGLPYTWLAMGSAPVALLIYVSTAGWFIKRCHHLLPAAGDGAVVGLGVGTVPGLDIAVLFSVELCMAVRQAFGEAIEQRREQRVPEPAVGIEHQGCFPGYPKSRIGLGNVAGPPVSRPELCRTLPVPEIGGRRSPRP